MAEEMRSRAFGSSKLAVWSWCVTITVLSLALPTSGQGCNTDLAGKVTKFPTANLLCKSYYVASGHTFYIWALKDNVTQVTTIVYAAPLSLGRWAGLGFSADGIMVGSTALISTLNAAGVPIATVYNLLGRTSDQVVPGTGLSFVGGLPGATYDPPSSTVYVSFQVNFANSTAKSTYLLMAYGAQNSDGTLAEHDSRISTSAQFISGIVAPQSAASILDRRAKTHGTLNILGWAVLLPIGAMVARYARGFDPAWFYAHVGIQIVGFACIIAGVATGVQLTKEIQLVDLDAHRGLGIFLFVLAILQVLAVLVRPKKDAKVRKYWNWYHHWVGRLSLFLAAINIFVGLRMAHAGHDMKVGYYFILLIILVIFVILEALLWFRWCRHRPGRGPTQPEDTGFQFGGTV